MSSSPRFIPCTVCSEEVVWEFGLLDAGAYRDGEVRRHLCAIPIPEPLNERDFLDASDEQLEIWGTARIPEPQRQVGREPVRRKPTTEAFNR